MTNWSATNRSGAADGDEIIYYRKPDKGLEANWITYGDSASGTKLRDKERLGFQPLWKYGLINSQQNDLRAFGDKSHSAESEYDTNQYIWGNILSHPEGPAEFPVDQLIAFRWHIPQNCPVPEAYFPQLVGKKITQYTCPERCGRPPFVAVDGFGGISTLRSHLRVMHDWSQVELQAYGERVGIDFTKADVAEFSVQDVSYGAATETLSCAKCGEEFKGGMAAARLAKHEKNHPVAEIVTI